MRVLISHLSTIVLLAVVTAPLSAAVGIDLSTAEAPVESPVHFNAASQSDSAVAPLHTAAVAPPTSVRTTAAPSPNQRTTASVAHRPVPRVVPDGRGGFRPAPPSTIQPTNIRDLPPGPAPNGRRWVRGSRGDWHLVETLPSSQAAMPSTGTTANAPSSSRSATPRPRSNATRRPSSSTSQRASSRPSSTARPRPPAPAPAPVRP